MLNPKVWLGVMVGFIAFFHATGSQAGEPLPSDAPSREALYRQVLQQALDRPPPDRHDEVDLETDADFLKHYFTVLHAFESARLGPIQTSGELIDEGICPAAACDPGVHGPETEKAASLPRIETIRVMPLRPDARTATLTWDLPGIEQVHARRAPVPSHYQVLVLDHESYRLYELHEKQTFASPRGNRGRPARRNLHEYFRATHTPEKQHADRKVPQQYFTLRLEGLYNPQVHIRPVYAGSPLKPDGAAVRPGDSIPGAFSAPVRIHTTQRFRPGGGISAGSPLQNCIDQAVSSDKNVHHASQLQSLDCTNRNITSLDGIEQLSNLQMLVLDQNPLSDITLLSQLSNLQSLSLAFTSVHSIGTLGPLSQLQSLVIANTNVQDIDPIVNFNALESIHAQNNQISSIIDLSATSIRSIYLGGNPITDIAGIRGLQSLREIRLNHSNVGDLDPLIDNAEHVDADPLTYVDLSGNLSLYCPQIDALEAVIGSQNVIRPAGCKLIPVPQNLNPSANPAAGPFELTWSLKEGNPQDFSYVIERVDPSRGHSQQYSPAQGVTAYIVDHQLPIGLHDFKVRACLGAGSSMQCSGWSQHLEVVTLADPSAPVGDVIGYVSDQTLKNCIQQSISMQAAAGDLTALSCMNSNIATLEGLEYFPAIVNLYLNHNQITDAQSIASLPALNRLQIAGNQLQDHQLASIAAGGEGNYFDLNIGSNLLSDITALNSLTSVSWFSLWNNSITSIDAISGVHISTLYAWNNSIGSIPHLTAVRNLAVSNNSISGLEGFCTIGLSGCPSGQALSDTLRWLELSENPLSNNPSAAAQLANLNAITSAGLRNTGISTVDFADDWSAINAINVSANPISSLRGLSDKPGLATITVSGTALADFSSLTHVPNLLAIQALDATSLQSLHGVQNFQSLNTLDIAGSNLDPVSGLDPIAGLNHLSGLILNSNGIFNIAPIFQAIDNTPGLRRNYSVSLESAIDCGQIAMAIGHPQYGGIGLPQVCMPSIPEFQDIRLQDDLSTIALAWSPAIEAPAGMTGAVDHYVVQFDRPGGSPSEWPKQQMVAAGQLDLNWSHGSFDPDQPVLVSIRSCRAPGQCSPFSEAVYPAYPPQMPGSVLVTPGQNDPSATVNWNYDRVPPANQPETYFELRPLFPIGSVPVLTTPSGATGLHIPDVSIYPGLLARLYACQVIHGEADCGEPALVNFRTHNRSPDVAPVTGLNIDLSSNAQGAVIEWQHPEKNAYFRVKEFADGNFAARYLVGEHIEDLSAGLYSHQLTTRHFNRDFDQRRYEITACMLNPEGNERCSEVASVSSSVDINHNDFEVWVSRAITPVGTAPGVRQDVCWFQEPGMSSSHVKIRWSYDWEEGVHPGVIQAHGVATPVYFDSRICNRYAGVSPSCAATYNSMHKIPFNESTMVFDAQGARHWYWESGPMPKIVHQEPSRFAIVPDVDGQFVFRGHGLQDITAVVDSNGQFEPNLATQCDAVPSQSGRDAPMAGGPNALQPGHWNTDRQPRQGWRFFWANEHRRIDGHHDAFGVAYDLIGFWYTYKIIEGHWSPVWYYTRMERVESASAPYGYFFEGSLHYPQSTRNDLQVGTVQVYLDDPVTTPPPGQQNNNRRAFINLSVNQGDGHVQQQLFEIEDFTEVFPHAFAGLNPTSHWSGIWTEGPIFKMTDGHLGLNDMFLVEWISGRGYSTAAHFFDTSGDPIWLIDFNSTCLETGQPGCDSPTYPDYAGLETQSNMHVPFPGFDPFWDGSALDLSVQETLDMNVNATGVLKRQYRHYPSHPAEQTEHLFGRYCSTASIRLSDDQGRQLRSASLHTMPDPLGGCSDNISDESDYNTIRKTASLHHFGYEVVDADQCDLSQGFCELELDWFTDDFFPDARPIVLDANGNRQPLHQFCSNISAAQQWDFAVYDQPCIWDQAVQNYRFALIAGSEYDLPGQPAPILARSRVFSASGTVPAPNPETPAGPIADPGFMVQQASSKIGATRGDFRVNETGAATFMVPVMTVPGSGGVVPQVSLQYHSEGGIGTLGRGWSVGGLSVISRCGQTLESGDGNMTGVQLNGQDRFCLDGQRLMLTAGNYGEPGSRYRTEMDQFARITARGSAVGGGPAYFEVERKDGSVSIYGHDDDPQSTSLSARVLAPNTGVVFAWPVSRIEDSARNYIEFEYQQPDPANTIEWHPLRIGYTGHAAHDGQPAHLPFAHIQFNYSPLPAGQRTRRFVAGEPTALSRRLDAIESHGDLGIVRYYRIGYTQDGQARHVLNTLQECWDGHPNHCFEPTVFDWNLQMQALALPGGTAIDLADSKGGRLADLDGDGLNDYVYLQKDSGTLKVRYLRGRLDAAGQPNFGFQAGGSVLTGADGANIDPQWPPAWALLDIEGDGDTDIAYIDDGRLLMLKWNRFPSGGGAFGTIEMLPNFTVGTGPVNPSDLFAADWNGDGRTDLLLGKKHNEDHPVGGSLEALYVLENTTSPHTVPPNTIRFAVQPQDIKFELNQYYFDQALPGGPDDLPDCLDYNPWAPGNAPGPNCGGAAGTPIVRTTQITIVDGQIADFNGDGQVDFLVQIDGVYCRVGEPCDQPGPQHSPVDNEPNIADGEGSYSFFALMSAREAAGNTYMSIHNFIGESYDTRGGGDPIEWIRTADFNSDGLSDLLYRKLLINPPAGVSHWRLRLNEGRFNSQTSYFAAEVGQPQLDVIDLERAGTMRFVPTPGGGSMDLASIVRIDSGDPFISADYELRRFAWQWSPQPGWGAAVETLPVNDSTERNQWLFQDVTGNGIIDTVRLEVNEHGDDWNFYATAGTVGGGSPGYRGWYRIDRITDGLGAWTDVHYQSLVQPGVYSRETATEALDYHHGSAVYDITPTSYVVASATSLAPQYDGGLYRADGTTRVEYHYRGARIQGGGRGFLGFREVTSHDPQSGMLTRTRYAQAFPKIGLPVATRSWYLSTTQSPFANPMVSPGNLPEWMEQPCSDIQAQTGIFMGCSENVWEHYETVTGSGARHAFLATSREWSFVPVETAGIWTDAAFTHRVETDNDLIDPATGLFDPYGNVHRVDVNTYTSRAGAGGWLAGQTTVNTYANNTAQWWLGRLSCADVTSSRPNQATVQRISTFGYDALTGILNRETVHAADCGDPSGALTTVYGLDDYGNRASTTVTDHLIQPSDSRQTQADYDPFGRFVDVEWVRTPSGWRWTREVVARDGYGQPIEVRSGQDAIGGGTRVRTIHRHDFMGRLYYSYRTDGHWQKTRYLNASPHCAGLEAIALVEEHTTAGGSAQYVCKDVLGREVRSVSQGFAAGQWIRIETGYDHASRPVRVSTPYSDAHSPYCAGASDATCLNPTQRFWTLTFYDELGRVIGIQRPDLSLESFTYSGLTTTHTDALGQSSETVRNALGETLAERRWPEGPGGPVAETTHRHDALGRLIRSDGPLAGAADAIVLDYDPLGRKARVDDPDKGIWTYRYNAFGDLLCQRDAEGHGIRTDYDGLGRPVYREAQSGVPNTVYPHPPACSGAVIGTTSWSYSDVQGSTAFGQMTSAVTTQAALAGVPATTLTRSYTHDGLGRVGQVTTTIAEHAAGIAQRSYVERTTYDRYGRLFQQFDASGAERGELYVYNDQGYLEAIQEAQQPQASGTVYRSVQAMDARGQVLAAVLGNGTRIDHDYDPATGRPTLVSELLPQSNELAVFYEYGWDVLGRLRERIDLAVVEPRYEYYDYDHADRLTEVRHGSHVQQTLRYDVSGNILSKSDVAGSGVCSNGDHYGYGQAAAGPHAVTCVSTPEGLRRFDYDANGNLTEDRLNGSVQRSLTYTPFNRLSRVSHHPSGRHSDFHHGPERARFLQRRLEGSQVIGRTHYIGNVEVEFHGSGLSQSSVRRDIAGIALQRLESDGRIVTRYSHKDHLGSLVALSTVGGQIQARMGFDAWGQRRNVETAQPWQQWMHPTTPVWAEAMLGITPRGYTGHEHLDGHGLIHMNGRIYDPQLGRFLQADPLIEDSGTLNRYTYVHNNPLVYTDPSGYLSLKKLGNAAIGWVIGGPIGAIAGYHMDTRTLLSIAITALAPHLGVGFWGSVGLGAVAGGVAAGSVEGALWGAFSAGVFYGIGQGMSHLGEGGWTFGERFAQSVTHGMAGGVVAEMQGGKFGHGFVSAGVTKAASPAIAQLPPSAGVFVSAVVGGTVSEVTGGKFANGAVTSAMAFAFNQLVSSGWERHKASATEEGRARVAPHLSSWDGVSDAHQYENGATLLCVLATEGCSVGGMEQLYGPISAPFAEPYTGPGRSYTLFGNNPIEQRSPAPGVLLNRTLEGHQFHPGDVAHAIYEHRGAVWLYTQGRGVGGRTWGFGSFHISENAILGRALFNQSHIQATIHADHRTGGPNGQKRWQGR